MHPASSRNVHARNGELHPSAPRFTVPSPNGGNGASANVAPPSPNGGNGPPPGASAPSPNGGNGRDSRGRFARGNRGGPGNPFARRVARLRTLLVDLISDDDLRAVAQKLVERARSGDLAATRLVLVYLIGRPVEAADPDRLDLDEWRLCQELPTWEEVLADQPDKLDSAAACALAQTLRHKSWEEVRSQIAQKQKAAEGPHPGL